MNEISHRGTEVSLVAQLNKLARHNRQGSFRTKDRYYQAMKRFCHYLAEQYHLQKLSNVNANHLVNYVLYLQETGKSASTIKTDLAAIRFFHDKMDDPRHTLPSNGELGIALERRRFGGVDRTWNNEEFNKLLGIALGEDRYDYILALYLARYAGLRIHECFRIDTAIAEQALRDSTITIKGKGGKIRTVPINEQIALAMRKQLQRTARGHKLLVPDDMPTDRAIYRMETFILAHREEIQRQTPHAPLTFHGLRHTYAAEKYRELVEGGMGELDAHFAVSRLLGHERADVTNIYLSSVRKDGAHGE